MKNRRPAAMCASFETERYNYPFFLLPDGQDGLSGPAVSSRLGRRGLGSGNHSVMQTASEIPQRFVDVTGTDRYVENQGHRVPL